MDEGQDERQPQTFRIFGRAHPERRPWWFAPFRVEWRSQDGRDVAMQCHMKDSNFHASLTVTSPLDATEIDPMDAKVQLEALVRARLDSIGLLHGAAIDCEVIQLELPDGAIEVLDTSFPGLQREDPDAQVRSLSITAELVTGIRLGLADLRQAIRTPLDTALFAYRGLDGLRADVAQREDIKDEAKSWARIREITGVERSQIDATKALADARRHGVAVDITHDQRAEALQLLQAAILAYAEWCQREVPEVRVNLSRTEPDD